MIRRALILAGMISCGQIAHASEPHTVIWYVNHPSQMREQLASCRNDPGYAKSVPDCENVTQAQLVIASNEAWSRFATAAAPPVTAPPLPVPAPSEIQYWRAHEGEMLARMRRCRSLTQTAFRSQSCATVYASAQEIRR